jgi:DNA-binding transcriptional LysR family regulator
MIDRYHLRYFLAVVDHGNFSRAASFCNVTQPTLSVGIGKLEQGLGAPLFIRTSRRVQLTPAGAKFLTYARRIEADFNQAVQSMTDASSSGIARLGVLKSLPARKIARLSEALLEAQDWRIEIVEGTGRDIVNMLTRGRIDIGLSIVTSGHDRFAPEIIFEEGYGLALSSNHRLAGEPVIAGETLAEETMIVRRHCEVLSETSRYFIERGVRPHFAFRSTSDERVCEMVASGVGLTIMPDCYDYAGVVRLRLVGFDHRRAIGLLHGDRASALPARLLDQCRRIGEL